AGIIYEIAPVLLSGSREGIEKNARDDEEKKGPLMKTTTIEVHLLEVEGMGELKQSQTLALPRGSVILGIGIEQNETEYGIHVQTPLGYPKKLDTYYIYFLKAGDKFNVEQARYMCSFTWEIIDPYHEGTTGHQTYH